MAWIFQTGKIENEKMSGFLLGHVVQSNIGEMWKKYMRKKSCRDLLLRL